MKLTEIKSLLTKLDNNELNLDNEFLPQLQDILTFSLQTGQRLVNLQKNSTALLDKGDELIKIQEQLWEDNKKLKALLLAENEMNDRLAAALDQLEAEKKDLVQEKGQLQEESKELNSNLHDMQEEIQQLNLTLLHQQKISSKISKGKRELIDDYNLLEKENETLKQSLNNLKERPQEVLVQGNNNYEVANRELAQQNLQLQVKVNNLLSQKQSSLKFSELIVKHKEKLLVIGGIAIIGYLLLKE